MPPNPSATPSAWDDDWENIADKQEDIPEPPPAPEPRLSRAERKLKHQEANRQLWEEASKQTETPIFIQARSPNPPLTSTPVKTAVKVLARKPIKAIAKPSTSTATQPIEDEPDSEEEERQRAASQFAERQAQAAKEREEKQRKYAEVRERLFGPGASQTASNSGRPGSGQGNRPPSSGTASTRGAGRGRGPGRSGNNSPAKNTRESDKLYDPEYTPKPGSVFIQRREAGILPQRHDEKPIREPRGPDGNGRGFAIRSRGGASGGV